jgi:long-chain fatty acid transport protein
VSVGLGVFSPYGLTLTWAPGSEGRFVGYRSDLRVTHVQPTVAARFGDVSVGAGLNVGISSVRLQRRLDLAAQRTGIGTTTFAQLGVPAGTDFADVNLTANDVGLGWHAGLLWRPHDALSLGARWLGRQVYRYDAGEAEITQIPTGIAAAADIRNPGTGAIVIPRATPFDQVVAAQFTGNGPLVTQAARTALVAPEQAVVGLAVRPLAGLQLMFDAQWTNWAVFEDVRLEFDRLPDEVLEQRYRATWGYRLGAEYMLGAHTAVRTGWATNQAAAPAQSVTPVLPEARRRAWTLGLGRQFGERFGADLSYMYLDQADRAGRSVAGGVAQNDGTYTFDAHLVGLTFTYRFARIGAGR